MDTFLIFDADMGVGADFRFSIGKRPEGSFDANCANFTNWLQRDSTGESAVAEWRRARGQEIITTRANTRLTRYKQPCSTRFDPGCPALSRLVPPCPTPDFFGNMRDSRRSLHPFQGEIRRLRQAQPSRAECQNTDAARGGRRWTWCAKAAGAPGNGGAVDEIRRITTLSDGYRRLIFFRTGSLKSKCVME